MSIGPLEFEQAFFAQTVWVISRSSNLDEMLAVASVVRNHVQPRLGQITAYKSYYEACLDFLKIYPSRALPSLSDPSFVSKDGLLFHIGRIYTCEDPDVTATHDHPNGAKYFANEPDEWFRTEIIGKPELHPLLGQWGTLQFFG